MGSIHTIVGSRALLVRGHQTVVAVGLYDSEDVAVVPTSWTVELLRAGASVLTDSGTGAVEWTETVATTVEAADDYYLQWVFTESDGTTTPYRQDAAVCLQDLHPVIRVQNLVDRVPRLALDAAENLLSPDTAEAKSMMLRAMSVAWDDLESWLWRRGNRSHLILNSYDLADLHTLHALEVLFAGVASSLGGQFLEMSRDWGRLYAAAKRDMVLQYAPSTGDSVGNRNQAVGPIFTGGAFDVGTVYDYQRSIPSTRR